MVNICKFQEYLSISRKFISQIKNLNFLICLFLLVLNLVEKAYIIYVGYETTLGATVLENLVIRNGKEHSHNKVSDNYLGSPTEADHHNSRRSQH